MENYNGQLIVTQNTFADIQVRDTSTKFAKPHI